ncbi:MAG TPA: hypothetical protein VJO12_08315 [Stellaceae bacterium]|nr:hypothetical protein [Stellaceae bacterium]
MRLVAHERRLRSVVKHGWSRLVSAARPRYRVAAPSRERHFPLLAASGGGPTPPQRTVDLVALTILAVNRLGPATLRTVAHGKPLTVTVPDARTGEIFRAALAEMQKTRLTDRLIAIVDDDAADARRA